jgi:hypothetical protein
MILSASYRLCDLPLKSLKYQSINQIQRKDIIQNCIQLTLYIEATMSQVRVSMS